MDITLDITINASFLPHTDPEESLAFYRDALGFDVRKDVGYEDMRWITIGPSGRPDVNIVLTPPAADPGITDDERRIIAEMMAKGTYALFSRLGKPHIGSPQAFSFNVASISGAGAVTMEKGGRTADLVAKRPTLTGEHLAEYVDA